MKKNSTQLCQNHYYFHFYLKNKANTPKYHGYTQFARQKDRGCLSFMKAIIPIWWKQLSWTCNNSASIKTTLTIKMKTTHRSRTIQTEPPSNQQQQEYRETRTTKITNTSRKLIRDSPHNNRSLHNNLPGKFRNVVPEVPTQNMTAQPQSMEPLVSPHRSHSCNIKNTVFNATTEPKLKINKLCIY